MVIMLTSETSRCHAYSARHTIVYSWKMTQPTMHFAVSSQHEYSYGETIAVIRAGVYMRYVVNQHTQR